MKGIITQLRFRKKGVPIPADYRPMYKIGHIVLILAICCRSNKASLMKLHFMSWSIKSKRNILTVQSWIKDNFKNDYHVWGVEPTVNRAVAFARGEGLIEDEGGEYNLTQKGFDFFKTIKNDNELFEIEKAFLEAIGKNGISEKKIHELASKFF